uniref:Uncharacterized protein n=1 Tax=Moniliophthora roreri TaxID=221103 RepID=A0A0W0F616_MONRR
MRNEVIPQISGIISSPISPPSGLLTATLTDVDAQLPPGAWPSTAATMGAGAEPKKKYVLQIFHRYSCYEVSFLR